MTTITTPTRRQLETITSDKRLIVAFERLFEQAGLISDESDEGILSSENLLLSRSSLPVEDVSEPLTADIESLTADIEYVTADMEMT